MFAEQENRMRFGRQIKTGRVVNINQSGVRSFNARNRREGHLFSLMWGWENDYCRLPGGDSLGIFR